MSEPFAILNERAQERADASMRASLAIAHNRENSWTGNMLNGAVIGHLLVAWPMILAAIFFFTARGADVRNAAISTIASGALALAAAWFAMGAGERGGNGPLRAASAFFTILAWLFIFGCAIWSVR